MTIDENATVFHGLPVEDYDPEQGLTRPLEVAYRVRLDYVEEAPELVELLEQLCDDPAAARLRALLIGAWGTVSDSEPIVEQLTARAPSLRALEALFLGDMTFEECEISWIRHGDITPLLHAFPRLRTLRVRGADGLAIGPASHAHLTHLAFESGGLPDSVIAGVLGLDLPALTHLELWLGTEDYGRDGNSAALDALFTGRLFPKLNHLGLRNAQYADALVERLAASPLLGRLDVLDLSLGDLGDDGVHALARSPHLGAGTIVDIHRHYALDIAPLRAKVRRVIVGEDDPQSAEPGDDRYIAVSE